MKTVKFVVLQIIITLSILLVGLVVVEGVGSLIHFRKEEPSMTYRALKNLGWIRDGKVAKTKKKKAKKEKEEEVAPVALPTSDFIKQRYITDPAEVEALLPDFSKAGVLLGNSPFEELVTEEARVTHETANGLELKPDLSFETGFLRSAIFNPIDPLTYAIHLDHEKDLSPAARAFLERYGFGKHRVNTDSRGDRKTEPVVDAEGVVLIVGDSVAFGVGVPDGATLASCLQRRDSSVKYVNCGVPGASPVHNRLRLIDRLEAYKGRVKGLIYVHCENDYTDTKGITPEEIVNGLVEALKDSHVEYRVFVAQQYLYRSVPFVFPEREEEKARNYYALKDRLITAAKKNGFETVDGWELVNDYAVEKGSLLSGAALYVDHAHYSSTGLERLASKIKTYAESRQ